MIALFCLLAVLGLGSSLENLPTRLEIESSINRTIDEVERMVKQDSSLPRLSRSQIVDILFNITSKDMDSYEDHVESTREQYQRALIGVLPDERNKAEAKNPKDLYAKSPLEQLQPPSSDTRGTKSQTIKSPIKTSDNLINTMTKKSEDDTTSGSTNHWKNHRHTYANVDHPTEESILKLLNSDREDIPEKFSFNLDKFGTNKPKETPVKGNFTDLWRSRSTTTRPNKLEIVYSTSVTQRPATKAAQSSTRDTKGFRPTMPPTRSTQNILTSDQWRYNAPPLTTTTKPRWNAMKNRKKSTDIPFLPTMMIENDDILTTTVSTKKPVRIVNQQKSTSSPWAMENLRIVDENEKLPPIYVTPMSSAKIGHLDAGKVTAQVTKKPMHMREEVKDLLASIGLQPKKENTNENLKKKVIGNSDEIFGNNFQIPNTNNVLLGQASGLTAIGIESPSISNQNTFENTPQDVKSGMKNLSPDVQLLFQRFGLRGTVKDLENIDPITTTVKPRPVTTQTSFWNNFKPLPASEIKDEGMKDFLAKFGLGIKDNRNEKSMRPKNIVNKKPPSLIDAVPANMKRILENIGLITRSIRPDVSKEFTQTLKTTETPELHVFKPHQTSFDDDKQRLKIHELLDKVKMVQEGKADVASVQKAAQELLDTTKSLKNGPDPLSLEEILNIYKDDVKNDIKRQQNPKELADIASSETSTASSTTTTTSTETTSSDVSPSSMDSSAASSNSAAASPESLDTDAKNFGDVINTATTETSNIDALADSFGGSTSAPDPILPTRRKTGLYFLVDWNTFLEVGEDGSEKVNLRFLPKAGDRTRFLPVTVP